MWSAQYIQDAPGTFRANSIEAGKLKLLPIKHVVNGLEYCRSFAQYRNEVKLVIISNITDKNPHHQLANNGREAELARREAPDQRNEENAGNTQYNRRNRVAVWCMELKGRHRGRHGQQRQQAEQVRPVLVEFHLNCNWLGRRSADTWKRAALGFFQGAFTTGFVV